MTHTHTQQPLAAGCWRHLALSQPHFPRPPSGGDQLATTCPAHIKPKPIYVSPVSFESSEVFPCFSIIHIHHLFTIYSPSFFASHFSILQQTEICCPYLSGQDGQAEAGQLRMRSSELVCCQVNALQVRDVANWESNPHFVHQQSIHVLTLWSSCGLADCDFSWLFDTFLRIDYIIDWIHDWVLCFAMSSNPNYNVERSQKMIWYDFPFLIWMGLTIAMEKDHSQWSQRYSIVLPRSPSRFPLTGGVPPMPNRLSTQQNVAVFAIGSARKQRRLSLFEMRMGVQGLCLQATQQIQWVA